MRLSHFTPDEFEFDPCRTYGEKSKDIYKPRGLWLSDESDHGWRKFCEGDKWNLGSFKYQIDFWCTTSTWILINTLEELNTFTKKYATSEPCGEHFIDWSKVKSEFTGILITPYQWEARLSPDSPWYYPWDCASACVWDLTTVEIYRGER